MSSSIRFINLEEIKFSSINRKYIYNPRTKQLVISPEYRRFKEILCENCKKDIKLSGFITVMISMKCYHDIDNAIKCILDVVDQYICNDKLVRRLIVDKEVGKIGKPGTLRVDVESWLPSINLA